MADNKALAAYKEEIAKEIAGQKSTLTTGGNSKIKAKGKVFTLPNGTTSTDPLSVVIVEYTNSYAYFDTPYNAKDPKPPVCHASNKEIGELAPDPKESSEVQAEKCSECSLNEWGSAGDGSNRKGCTQSITIAVASPNADPDEEPMTLNIPATSMKTFGNYVTKLGTLNMLPNMMVTEISFDTAVDYNKFLFKPVKPVGEENLGTFFALKNDAKAILG